MGWSYSSAIIGHCLAGVQKRLFGWLDGTPDSGVQELPFQSVRCAGAVLVMSSHHTSPSSVRATLVKIELPRSTVRIALGLE